jgi:single-stranded-DNA-specific exonuclease
MQKKWIYKPTPSPEATHALATALNIDEYLAILLLQRGIYDFDTSKSFFRPALEDLHNPFLMKDMDKAVERLEQAIANREKILIYGDYDVDGTTSVALMYGFLQTYHKSIDFYIPDRQKEGYGISPEGIQWAKENGFSLVIALDCGIKSVELTRFAKSLGVDFIICDHHIAGEVLPDALAVLNPKRIDCPYPFKELSGCGIGFKFLQAFCEQNQLDVNRLYDFIDLVAVSISADLVSITGENRILTFYGLQKLNSQPRVGLKALMEIAGFTSESVLNVSNVVFAIGPRINAVGRLGHAGNAVKLLIAQNRDEANHYAQLVNSVNLERKDLDAIATQEALAMIENEFKENKHYKTTILFKADWHKGIVGIVAARCIDVYHRPTIIFTENEGIIVGSARSVNGFDLYQTLESCADLLLQYGGHKQAAGLSLLPENLPAFRERFEAMAQDVVTSDMLTHIQEVDLQIDLQDITPKFFRILRQMAPFGPDNMRPVFVTKNILPEYVQLLRDKHLKFRARSVQGNIVFDVVGFGMVAYYEALRQAKQVDICYTIEENFFQGKLSLQLRLKDIKFVE